MTRSDSRNEVFLSALDLFSLLLFAFLRLALASRGALGATALIPLPVIEGGRDGAGDRPPHDIIYVKWTRSAERDGACALGAGPDRNNIEGAIFDVSCSPRAFGGRGERNDRLGSLSSRRAVILCPTDMTDAIESCARLQWVVAEHGFQVSAAVAIKAAGEAGQ